MPTAAKHPTRTTLDARALTAARVPLSAPLCLRADAWGSEVELPASAPAAADPYEGVALVTVHGPLAGEPDTLCGWFDGYDGPEGIAARFARAHADPAVKAVLLHFDTPGGTSAGMFSCIRRMQGAASKSGKPTLGYVKQACSAGYALATVCDGGLYGDVDCEAGSIGSYITHAEESAALAKEGVAITLICDPPGKVAGNPYEPLSDTGRARNERDVKACTAQFFALVTAARPDLDEKALRKLDGDVLAGQAAVDAGLITALADPLDVVALALAMAAQPKPKEAP